jgi:hypothetical protein
MTLKHSFWLCSVITVAMAVSVGACRSSSGNGGRPDAGDGGDGGNGDATIYQVQDGTFAEGDKLALRGVVVVAKDTYGNSTGNIWVAEPDPHPTYGRAYSGVQVRASVEAASDVAVGDLVDIADAQVQEFWFDCDIDTPAPGVDCADTLNTVTQVEGAALTITTVGAGVIPAAEVVSAPAIAADLSEGEKWESVLVRLEDVATLGPPFALSGSDTSFRGVDVTGPISVVSSMTPLPEDLAGGECFASVTGIVAFFRRTSPDTAFPGAFQLIPREAADYGGEGSGCPAQETTAEACVDGEDNDFNGYIDCADFSCQTASPGLCEVSTTVVAVQDGTLARGTSVDLKGVVVTALGPGGRLWIQDAGSTADFNGVLVYRGSSPPTLDPAITVGSLVNVTGRTDEFRDETDIAVTPGTADVELVANTGSPAVRADVPAATLGDAGDAGEPYEGMLVEIRDIAVVTSGTGTFTVGVAGMELTVGNFVFPGLEATGVATCYARIRGVMSGFGGARKLYPRTAADIALGGNCD